MEWLRISEKLRNIINRSYLLEDYVGHVFEIIKKVREFGDKAVLEFTEKFDKVKIESVKLSRKDIELLSSEVSDNVKELIGNIINSVDSFYRKLIPNNVEDYFENVKRSIKWIPLSRVGIYVPRNYVSTLIMTVIPAKIAGVERIYITTPPLNNGLVNPYIAYVAKELGIEKMFKVGGAQAIAAFAFGTETIPKVDKIIGPGNIFVQVAKYLVSPYVGVDGFEGPTEIVIYADSGEPKKVALDLVSQLEHGKSSFGVIISIKEDFLRDVENKINKLVSSELGTYCTVLASSIDEDVYLINEIAPEHLVIYSDKANEIVEKIRNVGVISLNTPSPFLDYSAGPSHVLPTTGSVRWRGLLTPTDFMKPIGIVEGVCKSLIKAGIKLAELEQLKYHAQTLKETLNSLESK